MPPGAFAVSCVRSSLRLKPLMTPTGSWITSPLVICSGIFGSMEKGFTDSTLPTPDPSEPSPANASAMARKEVTESLRLNDTVASPVELSVLTPALQ